MRHARGVMCMCRSVHDTPAQRLPQLRHQDAQARSPPRASSTTARTRTPQIASAAPTAPSGTSAPSSSPIPAGASSNSRRRFPGTPKPGPSRLCVDRRQDPARRRQAAPVPAAGPSPGRHPAAGRGRDRRYPEARPLPAPLPHRLRRAVPVPALHRGRGVRAAARRCPHAGKRSSPPAPPSAPCRRSGSGGPAARRRRCPRRSTRAGAPCGSRRLPEAQHAGQMQQPRRSRAYAGLMRSVRCRAPGRRSPRQRLRPRLPRHGGRCRRRGRGLRLLRTPLWQTVPGRERVRRCGMLDIPARKPKTPPFVRRQVRASYHIMKCRGHSC